MPLLGDPVIVVIKLIAILESSDSYSKRPPIVSLTKRRDSGSWRERLLSLIILL